MTIDKHALMARRAARMYPTKKAVREAHDPGPHFTDGNEHNPLVLADCPRCGGSGMFCEEGDGGRSYGLAACDACGGSGATSEVVHFWPEDREPMPATLRADGWLRCPYCGKLFSTRSRASWTGLRHRTCGQKIVLQKPD